MGGVPCLRGLRIPVATVVNMVAGGLTVEEIIDELPPLEPDDIAAAVRSLRTRPRTVRFCFKRLRDFPHRTSPRFAPISRAAVGDERNVVGKLRSSEVERCDAGGISVGTQFVNDLVAGTPTSTVRNTTLFVTHARSA